MTRAAVVVAALAALLAASPASTAASAPAITLLAPADGASVASGVGVYPTFSWHADWDAPEATTVRFETTTDPAFAVGVNVETRACPATDVNCWSSVKATTVYGPPGSVWYWRVGLVTSSGIVYSATYHFTVVAPPDRDGDGVFDPVDNCPYRANPDQRDSNRDGKGDACQADRVRPRVLFRPGSASRGHRAFFHARLGDDRGSVRFKLTLQYHGRSVMWITFPWVDAPLGSPVTIWTTEPLPRFLPPGRYLACLKVWDRAFNHALSCSTYRIR
jgi:hypothetical protein